MGVALEGMQHLITDRAVPILQQIITKLEHGHTMLEKYHKKWKLKAIFDSKGELVRCFTYFLACHYTVLSEAGSILLHSVAVRLSNLSTRKRLSFYLIDVVYREHRLHRRCLHITA